jgi:hypothetical protein
MDTAQAKRLVVVSCASAAAVASLADLATGTFPSARIPVGAFAAGAALTLLAEVAPQLAGGFAAVILVTAVFVVGGKAWPNVAAIFGTTPTAGARPSSLGAVAGAVR